MRLFSSAWIVHVAVLAFTGCSFAGKIRHASLAARQTPAELVEPSLDQFLNQTVLDTLKTIPHVGAEWADEVTNTTFLANLKVVDDLGLRGLSPSSNPLQPRFINVGRCHIEHKRLALRQALGNVRSMLRAVESIEKVHPVWQALISARWRDSDDTLKRTKGLFKVLADTIDDQFKKIYLSCNPTLGCLHKRRAPGTEQIQVTIAEYDFDIQTINMCESFFGRALQGGMQCLDNLPIGQYKSPELWLIHELFHAVFDELGANDMNFFVGDLAYDFGPCSDLARGLCSNAEDGIPCWSDLSLVNVDTLSWIINGYHWYQECTSRGLRIPLK